LTLELVGITKKFPGFILGPLDLKIENGKVLVIIGPTGSGKSTILNLIAGLLKPDSGSISIDGLHITNMPIHLRRIGITFQNPSLFPNMSTYENIVFGLTKKARKENNLKIMKLLKDLNLSQIIERNTQGLSGGEMQKVSLARMLITDPKIMLLDEPLAHLDASTKRILRLELRRILIGRNVPSIYVTHFEDDVYALADYVAILQAGKLEYIDKIESMLSNENHSPFASKMFGQANYVEGEVIRSNGGISAFSIGSNMVEIIGNHNIGTKVGIVVKPEDIILSREIVRTSARNMIKAEITNIANYHTDEGGGIVDVHLRVDSFHMISRITEKAMIDLGLRLHDYVFAIFKASSPQIIREG
jgi:ABC-type Fe3+/spermidine/putrescine transport system ATPase subunit